IKTVAAVEARLAHITTPMTLSIIGCVVNGPGEARETDVGFTGGGNGTHQVYIAGTPHHRLKGEDIVDHLVRLAEQKAAEIQAREKADSTTPAAAQWGRFGEHSTLPANPLSFVVGQGNDLAGWRRGPGGTGVALFAADPRPLLALLGTPPPPGEPRTESWPP